jgi:putative NADH-flavin reductase
VKAGDVDDSSALATLVTGNDAVISVFNPGWKNPNLYDDQRRSTSAIIAAVKQAGIRRVLWGGRVGGLEVNPSARQCFTVGY